MARRNRILSDDSIDEVYRVVSEDSDDGERNNSEPEDNGGDGDNNVFMTDARDLEHEGSPVERMQSTPNTSPHHSTSDQPVEDPPPNAIKISPKVKKSDAKRSAPTRHEESMDEEGQNCTICFEPWTNSSEHRLVSLRCGHLFGRSCITRWLKGQNSRCPQCNARARKSEIRNIYSKAVKVMDSTERDKALHDLQKESEKRRKAEMETAHERLKYVMKMQECEMLKKQLMEANRLLQEYRCNSKIMENSLAAKKIVPVFSFEKSIEIAKNGGCRITEVSDLLGMILVTQPSINELFPGYGFRKISTLELKPAEFVLVHQKPIKDIAFHCHDGLVLTASLDRSVKLTNVLTNSVVHTYSLDSDVWSCAWDSDDPTYFYAGVKTGSVFLFDIRVTSQHVQELPKFGHNTPAVALRYLHKTNSTYSKSGAVVGKLSDCGFYQKLDQSGEYTVLPLPIMGPITSLSTDPASGHFLVSCRPSLQQSRVTHTVCELVSDQYGQAPQCNAVQTILGGRTQVQLTRSKLLSHPDDATSLLICAGDEDAHGALIWDGSSGKRLDHLKTDSPVLDIADLKINQKSALFALTDKNLRVYSWNDQ